MTKTSASGIIKKPSSQDGQNGALLHMAVSPLNPREFSNGGGGADVEKEAVESSAYRDLRGVDSNFTYHKSVLTARLVPRQSANLC